MNEAELQPAVFTGFRCRVPASAIDYNGHMNDAAYAQVFADANETFLVYLGMSVGYREMGCSLYTVETTIRFVREVGVDAALRAESRLASHDAKRARIHTALIDDVGAVVATSDSLYLHVDTVAKKVVPFPPDRLDELDRVQARHDAAPEPTHSGDPRRSERS
jgi:acyl-CoA thioesterase FadM